MLMRIVKAFGLFLAGFVGIFIPIVPTFVLWGFAVLVLTNQADKIQMLESKIKNIIKHNNQ